MVLRAPRQRLIPRGYQELCAGRLEADPMHLLLQDPGLGKTVQALLAFLRLRERLDVSAMLVVAPLRVCTIVWPEEVAKWDLFAGLRIEHLGEDGMLLPDGPAIPADVYTVNPERLAHLFGEPEAVVSRSGKKRSQWRSGPWNRWRVGRPDMLVVDELHKFKRKSGRRAGTLGRYLPTLGRRAGLTGTPVPNGYHDLHGQMYLIDGGLSLGKNVGDFEAEHFDSREVGRKGRKFVKHRLKPGHDELIRAKVAPRCSVLRAEDYVDLPEEVHNQVRVDLPAKVQKTVDELTEHLASELDGTMFVVESKTSCRLRQVINGVAYTALPFEKQGSKYAVLHEAKLDAAVDLLDEIGEPAIVAYEFWCERDALEKRLRREGKRVGCLGRGVTDRQGRDFVAAWNARELDAFLIHPEAGGEGQNLQYGGRHTVWLSPTWNLTHWIQLKARVRRPGQSSDRTFVHQIVARNTLDARVARVREDKDATEEAFLEALKGGPVRGG